VVPWFYPLHFPTDFFISPQLQSPQGFASRLLVVLQLQPAGNGRHRAKGHLRDKRARGAGYMHVHMKRNTDLFFGQTVPPPGNSEIQTDPLPVIFGNLRPITKVGVIFDDN
jgi:hypothetical protein